MYICTIVVVAKIMVASALEYVDLKTFFNIRAKFGEWHAISKEEM